MQLPSFIPTLALAATALASPACNKPNPNPNPNPKPIPSPSPSPNAVSGKDTNGSIFMFGDQGKCRTAFWQRGACGLSTYFKDIDPNELSLVALPSGIFDPHGQAQNNKLCGKVITMTYNGVTRQAVVADENMSSEQSIDMCLDLWAAFGGRDEDGTLLKGIEWSIAA